MASGWRGSAIAQEPLPAPVPAALVTGASRGIGAAIARRLAHEGFDVAIHYNQDKTGAEATAAAVRDAGAKAVILRGDLADNDVAQSIAEQAMESFDELTVFVANAGNYDRVGLSQLDARRWRSNLAVNLDAPAIMSHVLAEALQERGGCIVHVSSIVASRGTAHGAAYAAAKAALLGLTKAHALELAPQVRVNAVVPGYIDTDMIGDDTAERRAQRVNEVPLLRIGTPQDVASVVAWLVSSDAAYVTGQAIHVNGGLHMAG